MLSAPEKIIFLLAVLASLFTAIAVSRRIYLTILRGQGKPDLALAWKRISSQLPRVIVLQPTFRLRFWTSLFHALVAWGFLYYLLVNLGDIIQGLVSDFTFLGEGMTGDIYRLVGDLLSVGVLVGMIALILRRWVLKPAELSTRQEVMLQPSARTGIRRDSIIVAAFILVHVGSRTPGSGRPDCSGGQ